MEPKITVETELRKEVEILLPDGKVLRGPRNTPVEAFMKVYQDPKKPSIVGAIVNYDLRELTYPIKIDSVVKPVNMSDPDGARIYRRSLTFLLEVAFMELYPEWSLTIDHSVSSGAYYCHIPEHEPFTQASLDALEDRMRALVAADEPMVREKVSLEQARQFFREHHQDDKLRLLKLPAWG